MNDRQLSIFLRHSFALEKWGEDAVKVANPELRRAMLVVQEIVRGRLPEEGLLRDKAIRDMMPELAAALEPYNRVFSEALIAQMVQHTADTEQAATEMIEQANPTAEVIAAVGLVAFGLQIALNSKVNDATVSQIFNLDGRQRMSPWTKSNVDVIASEIRKGVIDGVVTEEVAKKIVGPGAERRIRSQARSLAGTAVSDFSRLVHEEVWSVNGAPLKSVEWEFVALLDSKTCPTCAPLDGMQKKRREDFPVLPLVHVRCRCRVVPVDPNDPDDIRKGVQLKTEKPTGEGAYKTKIKGKRKGQLFYRKKEPAQGNTYAEYLAGSDRLTQVQFFGGGKVAELRADWFNSVVQDGKMTPEKALQTLIKGPVERRSFIVKAKVQSLDA